MTQPGAVPRFPTSLGASDPDTITLLGQNLAEDLLGRVGFGELAFWLVTQRRPTSHETRVFETVLVALADHGFTPTAIDTTAAVHLEPPAGITKIELTTVAEVPGIDEADFLKYAEETKEACPVSKALAAVEITLTARLA